MRKVQRLNKLVGNRILKKNIKIIKNRWPALCMQNSSLNFITNAWSRGWDNAYTGTVNNLGTS